MSSDAFFTLKYRLMIEMSKSPAWAEIPMSNPMMTPTIKGYDGLLK
jgi:hypothetical protein